MAALRKKIIGLMKSEDRDEGRENYLFGTEHKGERQKFRRVATRKDLIIMHVTNTELRLTLLSKESSN